MRLLAVFLCLSLSSSAFAAWGNWDRLEPDDEINFACSYPADLPLRGAVAGGIEILAEGEDNTFTAQAFITQMYAGEFKNGKEREKFKFEAKDGWPFGSTTLALKAAASFRYVTSAGSLDLVEFKITPPFKSGQKEKKEIKSVSFSQVRNEDSTSSIQIDKANYPTDCSVTVPACGKEYGASFAVNGYGSGSYRGCHQEGENVAKRYRVFTAYKTDMKDKQLLGELKVYSYEYSDERRLNIEKRLRQLGSSAHGWDDRTYWAFLDSLERASQLPEDRRSERLAELKETLAKALAGE